MRVSFPEMGGRSGIFLRRKISGVSCKRTIWSCGTGGPDVDGLCRYK